MFNNHTCFNSYFKAEDIKIVQSERYAKQKCSIDNTKWIKSGYRQNLKYTDMFT